MAVQRRDSRHADRVRAAICISLAAADGQSLTIGELVLAVRRLGVPLGEKANKVVADAIRWEVLRRHVRKTGRGTYAAGATPRSTLHYMHVRVSKYAADPTVSYSRPHSLTPPMAEPSIGERLTDQ